MKTNEIIPLLLGLGVVATVAASRRSSSSRYAPLTMNVPAEATEPGTAAVPSGTEFVSSNTDPVAAQQLIEAGYPPEPTTLSTLPDAQLVAAATSLLAAVRQDIGQGASSLPRLRLLDPARLERLAAELQSRSLPAGYVDDLMRYASLLRDFGAGDTSYVPGTRTPIQAPAVTLDRQNQAEALFRRYQSLNPVGTAIPTQDQAATADLAWHDVVIFLNQIPPEGGPNLSSSLPPETKTRYLYERFKQVLAGRSADAPPFVAGRLRQELIDLIKLLEFHTAGWGDASFQLTTRNVIPVLEASRYEAPPRQAVAAAMMGYAAPRSRHFFPYRRF